MDDYLYLFDIQNDYYSISKHAVSRFCLPNYHFCDATKAYNYFVYEDDLPLLFDEFNKIKLGEITEHSLHYRWLDRQHNPVWINCRGDVILDEFNKPLYLIGCVNEIGKRQKADNISGLLREPCLEEYVSSKSKNNITGYFMQIGIDDFDEINGRFGLKCGDEILKQFSMCMQSCINENQKIYELGNGRFIIMDLANHTKEDILELYDELKKSVEVALEENVYRVVYTISVGIVEIDKGKIYSYDTNYSGFLELKAQREEMEAATERKRQSILRVELEWVKRGARARSTKQKARLERYEEMKNQHGPQSDGQVSMSSITTRMGNTTIEIDGISKSYGNHTFIRDFSYIFLKNDRVGFVGTNGCGKTTLMKMLAGREEPDSGTIKVGQTIKIGYYSQEIETSKEAGIAYMDPNMRVIDYIRETAEFVRTEDGLISASAMLERFLFPPQAQYSLIGKLSGGERRRLNLLRVLMESPNVLILDEPTNDLDISTLTILEDYLDHYQGIVIIVSHDRYFLDRTVNRIFAFEDGGVLKQYEGGYTDYALKAGEAAQCNLSVQDGIITSGSNADSAANTNSSADGSAEAGGRAAYDNYRANRERKLKFSYKEKMEYETIEQDILDLEEKLESLDNEMAANATNSKRLSELAAEREQTEADLEHKMERWEYLEELAEKINAQNEN